MRLFILTALLVAGWLDVSAQAFVAEVRISIDEGPPMAFLASDGSFDSANEWAETNLAGLTEGSHLLSIQYRSDSGPWSTPVEQRIVVDEINLTTPPVVELVELWLNGNPASGVLGIAVDGNLNQAIEAALANLPLIPEGSNTLHVRYGSGNDFIVRIFADAANEISPLRVVMIEAWWNSDSTNSVMAVAADGLFNQAIETAFANLPNPGSGRHFLNVKTTDSSGNAHTYLRMVDVFDSGSFSGPELTFARLWWDNDTDNAIPLVGEDGEFNRAIKSALATTASPPLGSHLLNIQFDSGVAGSVFTVHVTIEESNEPDLPELELAEVWWNGNESGATQLAVVGGNWQRALSETIGQLGNPGTGSHLLHVSFGSSNSGNNFEVRVVVEDEYSFGLAALDLVRVYFDNNPTEAFLLGFADQGTRASRLGFGSINSAVLDTGYHWMHSEFALQDGTWSSPFTTSIYVDPCESSPASLVNLTGNVNLCANDSLLAVALSLGSSYEWYRNAQLIGSNDSLTISLPGYYYLVTYDSLGCASASNPFIINQLPTPELIVTSNSASVLCAGQSVTLNASGGFASYLWNNGSTGATLTTSEGGIFSVQATAPNGCTVSSQEISITQLPPTSPALVDVQGNTTLCAGETTLLFSAGGEPVTWSNGIESISIEVSTSGNYSYQFIDENGCIVNSELVAVEVFDPQPIIENGTNVSLCEGTELTLNAGLESGYIYQWYQNGQVIEGAQSSTLTVSSGGTYAIEAIAGDCSALSPEVVIVLEPAPLTTISAPIGTSGCIGDTLLLAAPDGSEWLWNNGATGQFVQVTASGNYQVLTTGTNGCQTLSQAIDISFEQLALSFSVSANVLFDPNLSASFSPFIVGEVAQFSWDFGDGNTSYESSPVHTYTQFGTWDVALTLTGTSGCTQTVAGQNLIQTWQLFASDGYQLPDTADIQAGSFLSGAVGCIVLANGTVLATEQGGAPGSWQQVFGPAPGSLNAIQLFGNANENTAVVVGDGGFAAIINQPGGIWITPATGTTENLTTVVPGAPQTDQLYAGGDNGTVLEYSNGTWNSISIPGVTSTVTGIQYWNGQVFAATGSGMFYGWNGSFWQPFFSDWGPRPFLAMQFGPGGIGGAGWCIIGGPNGSIWQSFDGGNSFAEYTYPYPYPVTAITIVNPQIAFCVGHGGMFLYTNDGGQTWQPYSIGTTDDLSDVEVSECKGIVTAVDGRYFSFDLPNYVHPQPIIQGADSVSYCNLDLPTLEVVNPRAGYTYTWSNAQSGTEIETSISGNYYVFESGLCGTASSDTLHITVESAVLWYPDLDGDGVGAIGQGILSCDPPASHYVTAGFDCYDDDPLLVNCCPGDINGDGLVNASDLSLLLDSYGSVCALPLCLRDFNGDAVINSTDLSIFLSLYGDICD